MNEDFIAGFFDAEGSYIKYLEKGRTIKLFQIECANEREKEVLKKIDEFLRGNYNLQLRFMKHIRIKKEIHRYCTNKKQLCLET